MHVLAIIGIILGTFILTELSAWVNHKFVMHGFMWYFHSDHHKKDHTGWFERNDLFFYGICHSKLFVHSFWSLK